MSRIPSWAYPVEGFGEGWFAWVRGLLRLIIPIAGFWIAVGVLGWWGLLTVPVLVLFPMVIDAFIMSIATRQHPPPGQAP